MVTPVCMFHPNCVATYDFKVLRGRWAYGCDAAREEFGLPVKDQVGIATKLDGSTTRRDDIPAEVRAIAADMGFDGGDDELAAMMEVAGYND